MAVFGKEDPRVELIRTGLDVLPEDNPVRRKLVEKLQLGRVASEQGSHTSVRQWLERVADISVRELLDLMAELEKARAESSAARPANLSSPRGARGQQQAADDSAEGAAGQIDDSQ